MKSKLKKIFFIMSTDDYSGAEAVNFEIIDNLKAYFDFYWVSKKGNINKFLEERNIRWIEIKKLSVSEIKRIIKENNPNILHATDYKASVICSMSNSGIPLIEHLHNNAPWLTKACINSFAFLYAGIRANKILTVSESIQKEYIFSKLLKNKIECVGNPVSRKKVLENVDKKSISKNYDICCVARIVEQKNPLKFLKIIHSVKSSIPNIRVVWVGKGEMYDIVKENVKNLNLEKNIDFVGFQKNPYIYMNQSKVFVLTSSTEGFGLVAFEALTLGLPCVVSNVGGLPSIVDDDCGKLCNTDSDFILEIEKLLKNNDYLKRKSSFAIEKSKKIENIDDYMKKIKKVYGGVLNEKKC